MKHCVALGIALGALLVTLVGCNDSVLEPAAPEPGDRPAPSFPPVARPAGIYDRISASFIPGSSRYVVYDDGAFSLQYVRPDWGFFEFPGRYSRADSLLSFDFEAWSGAGLYLADGIVRGDSLIVNYNEAMEWADFEDGVYLRTASTAAPGR